MISFILRKQYQKISLEIANICSKEAAGKQFFFPAFK